MISINIKPQKITFDKYSFVIEDNGITRLLYKHEFINVKITKPNTPKSDKQNKAFHSLLKAYRETGMHSAPIKFRHSLQLFKIWIKLQYGPCYCLDMDGQQIKVPKSWAEYTKTESHDCITDVIVDIHESGAYTASKKIQEILAGMEQEKLLQ